MAGRVVIGELARVTRTRDHRRGKMEGGDEFSPGLLANFNRIAHVIRMPVRDQNKIDVFQRGKFILASIVNRVREPGIDQKNFPSRAHDLESRLTKPGELRFHASDEIENYCSSKASSTI